MKINRSKEKSEPKPEKLVPESQPDQLKPANDQIGDDLANSRPIPKRGRPKKESLPMIIGEKTEEKPSYPPPTPETDMMAQAAMSTLCSVMALWVGEHAQFDPKRDANLVAAWSRYFSFKQYTDFPPLYVALAMTAVYAGAVLGDPRTRETFEARKRAKSSAARIKLDPNSVAKNN